MVANNSIILFVRNIIIVRKQPPQQQQPTRTYSIHLPPPMTVMMTVMIASVDYGLTTA